MNIIPWKSKRQEEDDWGWGLSPLGNLRTEMERLFDRFLPTFSEPGSGFLTGSVFPSLDVAETDSEITVRAEVPGIDPKELTITLTGQTLTLSGEKKETSEKTGENYYHSERRFGSFRRSIQLPTPVDEEKMTAEHKNGIVMIRLKKHQSAAPRRIPVKSAKD